MARGQQARHMIERLAEIVAIAQLRGTGMQCHPDPNGRLRRPDLGLQRLLHGQRRIQREPRRGERRKERVTRSLEHTATMSLDALTQDGIMSCECDLHRVWRALPQAGAALDVRQQERQRAARQRRRRSVSASVGRHRVVRDSAEHDARGSSGDPLPMPRQESVSRADTTEPTLTSGVAVGTVECPPPDRAAGSNGIDNSHLPTARHGIIAALRAAMLSLP